MTREIKFRGIPIFGKEFVHGDLIQSKNEADERIFTIKKRWDLERSFTEFEIKPETLGQFTGLKDKNGGKEIYEGDIVKVNDDQDGNRIYKIVFEEGCYYGDCIYTPTPSTTPQKTRLCDLDYYNCWSKEVIGNIHETPELLNQQPQTK